MIISWRHKGLKAFYETGSLGGIQAKHSRRLTSILQHLDAATSPEDMNLPGMRLHTLRGELRRYHAVSVSGNWRVIFSFEDKNAILVNYLDYH